MAALSEEKLGVIRITDDGIALCVLEAAMTTEGVFSLTSGFSESISKNLRGKSAPPRGIRINRTEEGVAIDIQVNVEYGFKIPEVAWNIQENVKRQVESMTGERVKAVNIHVQGVRMDGGAARNER